MSSSDKARKEADKRDEKEEEHEAVAIFSCFARFPKNENRRKRDKREYDGGKKSEIFSSAIFVVIDHREDGLEPGKKH